MKNVLKKLVVFLFFTLIICIGCMKQSDVAEAKSCITIKSDGKKVKTNGVQYWVDNTNGKLYKSKGAKKDCLLKGIADTAVVYGDKLYYTKFRHSGNQDISKVYCMNLKNNSSTKICDIAFKESTCYVMVSPYYLRYGKLYLTSSSNENCVMEYDLKKKTKKFVSKGDKINSCKKDYVFMHCEPGDISLFPLTAYNVKTGKKLVLAKEGDGCYFSKNNDVFYTKRVKALKWKSNTVDIRYGIYQAFAFNVKTGKSRPVSKKIKAWSGWVDNSYSAKFCLKESGEKYKTLYFGKVPSSKKLKVSISKKNMELTTGQSQVLKLENNKSNVKWTVSKKRIVQLKNKSKNGVTVVGKGRGKTVVTAQIGQKKYKCTVTCITKEEAALKKIIKQQRKLGAKVSTDIHNKSVLSQYRWKNNHLVEIYWFDKKLSGAISFKAFPYLKEINCSYNHLTSIDISTNLQLESFSCDNNKIKKIDLSKNKKLKYLYCDNNSLKEINLSNNKKLLSLVCEENSLEEIDLSNNINLEDLTCSYNHLTSLDVSANINLSSLTCDANNLVELDVSNNKKLVDLSCRENKLEKLDLSHNLKLEYLNCAFNSNLEYLDLSNNDNLYALFCDDIELEGVPEDCEVAFPED